MNPVFEYLDREQARFVEELCAYVRFPSVSAQSQHRKDMEECALWLLQQCRSLGLETRLCPTDGHPVVLAHTHRARGRSKPHYLVYGHYDVQPPEPFELWDSPPFQPRIVGRSLFARGASDNKGQHLAHLKAVEGYLKTGTDLPCDVTFLIEGEEEVGSRHLARFLQTHRAELHCAGVVISDTGIPGRRHPALTYALRGIVGFEIEVHGPARDLHSGIFGGAVHNPAVALAQMLARVHDRHGRVAIPGFYDGVKPLARFERRQLARLPFSDAALRKMLGVPRLFGERGYTPTEQRTARPTFEINGLTSGYQGEGSKTIIPAWARAKVTCRLVPDQEPDRVVVAVERFFRKICPPTVRCAIKTGHGAAPYWMAPTSPPAQAALRALQTAFGCAPVLLREGGSIPIVNQFRDILGAESILVGLALPDDNAHSPNEKFDLDIFARGQRLSACLWQELAALH